MTQTEDLDTRLAAALKERDRLAAEAQKIQGKKEAAEKALSDLRAEIVEKKLDPDNLDETIQTLESAYSADVEAFEKAVAKAKEAITPYLENP